MTVTNSTRMQLVVESDDETVDPFATNWPILDSYAGALLVANGVTPDPATLFDGSIIVEATSGISWIADLSSGSLVKRYLTYPFIASASKQGWAMTNVTDLSLQVPLDAVDLPYASASVNWDKVLVANKIKVPVRGIYMVTATIRDAHNSGNGSRSISLTVNGTSFYVQNEMIDAAIAGYTFLQTAWIINIDKDGVVGLNSWQSGTAPGSADFTLVVSLVNPIW